MVSKESGKGKNEIPEIPVIENVSAEEIEKKFKKFNPKRLEKRRALLHAMHAACEVKKNEMERSQLGAIGDMDKLNVDNRGNAFNGMKERRAAFGRLNSNLTIISGQIRLIEEELKRRKAESVMTPEQFQKLVEKKKGQILKSKRRKPLIKPGNKKQRPKRKK